MNNSSVKLIKYGQELEFPIRISSRAKKIFIKFKSASTLEMVVPSKKMLKQAINWAHDNENKIRSKLSNIHVVTDPTPLPSHISLLGEKFIIKYLDSIKTDVIIQDASLIIMAKPGMHFDVLQLHIQKTAEIYIPIYVKKMADQYHFTYHSVRVKKVNSIWGSCNSKRNLTFSYHLILAPLEVLNYVIAHELCHLIEMNHSKKFWNHVKNICPNYLILRKWLKTDGHLLKAASEYHMK